MTLALNTSNVGTPIFDELDAHFFSTPIDTQVLDADIVHIEDTPIIDTDEPGLLPEGAEIAMWILALGATIGTICWFVTLLDTSGIA